MTDSTPPPKPSLGNRNVSVHGLLINIVIPLLLLAGAGFFVYWLGTVEPDKKPPADMTLVGRMRSLVPVRIESLQSLQDTGRRLALDVDGTVVPFQEALVAAEIAGRVTMKSDQCEAGQFVQKGDLLMKVDRTDYELEVQRLTRQKEQEYQALREVDQEMINAQRLIKVAQEDVKLQQREVERQQSLPKNFASRAEIEQSERALLSARQQLVTVENQLDLLRSRRVRLEASEKLAATNLRAAEVDLARTEIRAPIDGVIVKEEADVNTFVNRGQTLVVIENTSKAEVSSSLRMDQLYWVLDQKSNPSESEESSQSRGYDLPETPALIEYVVSGRESMVYRWRGRLLSYDGIGLDEQTRTVPVRIVVDDPQAMVDAKGDPLLKIPGMKRSGATLVRGMYVRVKLLIQPKTPLVVIPARAIRPGNRVFEFVPDESVLAPSESKLDTDNPPTQDSESPTQDSQTVDSNSSQEPFDPNGWIAGRVISRRSITPINSLAVLDPNEKIKRTASEDNGKLWVCEVEDQVLGPDSWVVVSPIGSVDGTFLPARAEKPNVESNLQPPLDTKPKMAAEISYSEIEG